MKNQSAARQRSPFTKAMLAIVGIALFLGFMALGTWQVKRLIWKTQLIERVDLRVHSTPVAAPDQSQWSQINAANYEYLPVQAQGIWLDKQSVLAKALTEAGAGFWLLTPLQRADGSQILVNRGFTPEKLRSTWLKQISEAGPSTEVVTVTGLLRMSETGGGFLRENDAANGLWFSRDVAAIAQAQGLSQAAPYFIDLGVPASNPAHVKASDNNSASNDTLRPGMTVIQFSNSHLVYAFTWYGLAAMVLGAFWLVRKHEKAAKNS
ncbi:SURF1 family protein [Comamonas sp. Y33R10-2]|uniref:SURF1 family protein n=1 Tax=Comamonas sp. Y33R10-2 TaxID=2853257 RepID=UPI001C5CBB47|nr:SURF1 family protein [Comamonas sp. Y33R10-2]QXZ11091.1 SURF1 family protein [Comamonas sp. Y33R10-2]